MKKIVLAFLAITFGTTMMAQTTFRNISYEDAIKASKSEGKAVFVYFYDQAERGWKIMEERFKDPAIGDVINNKYIALRLDGGGADRALYSKHFNNGCPAYIVVDAENNLLWKSSGNKDPYDLCTMLSVADDKNYSLERMEARYNGGERNVNLIKSYAVAMTDQPVKTFEQLEERREEAQKMVDNYYSSLSNADRLSPENMFVYERYLTSSTSPAARFLVNNLSKLPADKKETITKNLYSAFERDADAYFSGKKSFNDSEFKQFKNDVKKLGLNKNKQMDTKFQFTEAASTMSADDFINFCKANYSKLTPAEQTTLFGGFASRVKSDNYVDKVKTALFLRDMLTNLDSDAIYATISQIAKLEGKDKKF